MTVFYHSLLRVSLSDEAVNVAVSLTAARGRQRTGRIQYQ